MLMEKKCEHEYEIYERTRRGNYGPVTDGCIECRLCGHVFEEWDEATDY